MRCPGCNSKQIKQRQDGMCRCHFCGLGFRPDEARKEPMQETRGGSGVIAGKILIGRGTRWGAGW